MATTAELAVANSSQALVQQPVSVHPIQPPLFTQTAKGLVPAVLHAPATSAQKAPVSRNLLSGESSVPVAPLSAPPVVQTPLSIPDPSLPVPVVAQNNAVYESTNTLSSTVAQAAANKTAVPALPAHLPPQQGAAPDRSVPAASAVLSLPAPVQTSNASPIPAAKADAGQNPAATQAGIVVPQVFSASDSSASPVTKSAAPVVSTSSSPVAQPNAVAAPSPITPAPPIQPQANVVALPAVAVDQSPSFGPVTVTQADPNPAVQGLSKSAPRGAVETVAAAAVPSSPPLTPTPAPAGAAHEPATQTAKQETAAKATSVSAQQSNAPIESVSADTKPAPAEPAAALNLSAAAVLQPQPLPVPLSATVTGSKDASVKPVGDATSSKLHVSTISDQSVSPTPAQTTTTGGNQGQSSNPQPDQNATPAPAISLGHTSTTLQDHTQIPATVVPTQAAVPLTAPAAHTTKPALPAAPNGSALPEPAPVVNTARLIQTATQSEMRVGLRSTEFGNISINTSATRDAISAQISLDHGELAKAIANHIPEMQSTLGGNQRMDVRIDMNGQAAGQGNGGSQGMSASPGDGSRGGQQPRANSGSGYTTGNIPGTMNVTTAAAIAPAGVTNQTRLDIRA